MKLKVITALLLSAIVATSCCSSKQMCKSPAVATDSHNAQNSLDWSGTYKGVLPAASSSGMETTIKLNPDMSYTYTVKYIDKSDKLFTTEGYFTWLDAKSGVINLANNPEGSRLYFMGENSLTHLDNKGKRIEGDLAKSYVLSKSVHNLIDHNWTLTELGKNTIKTNIPNILFVTENNHVSGYSGCNRFMGTYTLEGSKLKMGQMAATMMACPDMDMEHAFLKMLDEVDSYVVKGSELHFMNKESQVIAKFTDK